MESDDNVETESLTDSSKSSAVLVRTIDSEATGGVRLFLPIGDFEMRFILSDTITLAGEVMRTDKMETRCSKIK